MAQEPSPGGVGGGIFTSEYAGQLQVLHAFRLRYSTIPVRVIRLFIEITFTIVEMFVKKK